MTASCGGSEPGIPLSLWRNRSYNLLWSSQFLSGLGSNISFIAFPLLVLAITGSAISAGIVGTAAAAARFALRIPSGVLADRLNRKTLMLACDAIRLAGYGALALVVLRGHPDLIIITAFAVLDAAGGTVFETAEMAALRNVVSVEQVPAAHARNEARDQAAALAGPPAGGLLFAAARALPFAADAISYLLSFIGVALIREPFQQERTRPSRGAVHDVREGLRFCWRQPFVRTTIILAPPLNLAVNGLIFAGIVILRKDGLTPGLVGLFQAILSAGGLLGAVAAGPMQKFMSMRLLILGATWISAALIAAASFVTGSLLLAVPLGLTLVIFPAANAALFGYLAAVTPDEMQGRVISVLLTAATSMASLAPLLAGVLYESFGARGTVLGFTAATVVSAAVATRSAVIRAMAGKPGEEAARAARAAQAAREAVADTEAAPGAR